MKFVQQKDPKFKKMNAIEQNKQPSIMPPVGYQHHTITKTITSLAAENYRRLFANLGIICCSLYMMCHSQHLP